MCDYSLQTVKSRPAKVGEKLKTQHFTTCTTGFAALEDNDTAVCVLPGTELAFATPVRCIRLGWLRWKVETLPHATAIFRQVNKQKPLTHHDALEFPDGKMVLLNDLFEGQRATVLQLPAKLVTAAEMKAQERVHQVGWIAIAVQAAFLPEAASVFCWTIGRSGADGVASTGRRLTQLCWMTTTAISAMIAAQIRIDNRVRQYCSVIDQT
jgi:hypothetical protein